LDSLAVAIEDLHDPHNGAAAIRSLEAVGLSTLHVVENVEKFRFSPGVTIGCEKWLEIRRYQRFALCAEVLKEAGYQLYAACPDADCDLEDVPVDVPAVVVFGNEHAGLTAEATALCDRRMRIPMHGFTQSFNLSVSVALTVHRLAQRRRDAIARTGDLDDQKRAHLRARWYAHGVRGAGAIMARHVSEKTQSACSS
ncbi:MAG: RNA methyltransferase, partial [Myxococcota bacterium]